MKKIFFITLITLICSVSNGQGWDGQTRGKLAFVDAVGGAGGAPDGLDLRIGLVGKPALCTGTTPHYAYLNITDPNYKLIAALLISAFSTGQDITIISRNGANGACQIGYVSLGDNS